MRFANRHALDVHARTPLHSTKTLFFNALDYILNLNMVRIVTLHVPSTVKLAAKSRAKPQFWQVIFC
jgi:hypothetical protein